MGQSRNVRERNTFRENTPGFFKLVLWAERATHRKTNEQRTDANTEPRDGFQDGR